MGLDLLNMWAQTLAKCFIELQNSGALGVFESTEDFDTYDSKVVQPYRNQPHEVRPDKNTPCTRDHYFSIHFWVMYNFLRQFKILNEYLDSLEEQQAGNGVQTFTPIVNLLALQLEQNNPKVLLLNRENGDFFQHQEFGTSITFHFHPGDSESVEFDIEIVYINGVVVLEIDQSYNDYIFHRTYAYNPNAVEGNRTGIVLSVDSIQSNDNGDVTVAGL